MICITIIPHSSIVPPLWIHIQFFLFCFLLNTAKPKKIKRHIHVIFPDTIPGCFPAKIPCTNVVIRNITPYSACGRKRIRAIKDCRHKAVFLTGANTQSMKKTKELKIIHLLKINMIPPVNSKLVLTNRDFTPDGRKSKVFFLISER